MKKPLRDQRLFLYLFITLRKARQVEMTVLEIQLAMLEQQAFWQTRPTVVIPACAGMTAQRFIGSINKHIDASPTCPSGPPSPKLREGGIQLTHFPATANTAFICGSKSALPAI
jgi:hypothetical protein